MLLFPYALLAILISALGMLAQMMQSLTGAVYTVDCTLTSTVCSVNGPNGPIGEYTYSIEPAPTTGVLSESVSGFARSSDALSDEGATPRMPWLYSAYEEAFAPFD